MNEMKPEGVMMALDILDKMDFFQGQRAGRELWNDKPYEVQEQDIADFSQGIATVKKVIEDALALLREKDATIKFIHEDRMGWANEAVKAQMQVNEKDAEIGRLIQERDEARRDVGVAERNHYESEKEVDRLRHICSSYALQYGTVMDQSKAVKEIRDEVITEFTERLKAHECLPEYPWNEPFVLTGCIDQIAQEMRGEE